MPWELHIQRHEGDDCDPDDPKWSLGSLVEVHSLIESYFPDIDWENANRGVCSYDDGLIEFDLSGDPVGVVWLRVHRCDPAIRLIAMARARSWHVINDSTGDDLEDEEDVDDEKISRIQKEAAAIKSKLNSQNANSERKLPRIKSKVPLNIVEPACILDALQMILMNENEVTQNVYDEYSKAMLEDARIRTLKGQPGWGPHEVQLPDGRRFAALIMSRLNDEVNTFFDSFWKRTGRITGKVVKRFVVLEDGTKFKSADCQWVERVRGRIRTD